MNRPTKNSLNRRFVLILLLVIAIGVATGAVIGRSGHAPFAGVGQSAQSGLPLVTSASSAVRVVTVDRINVGESPVLNISLQNISTKNIAAYSLGTGKRWVTSSFYFTETSFAPNAIEKQVIPLSLAGFGTLTEFIVTGVIFDDGTTDGQAISVFRLKETRDGLRHQAQRLVPCLKQLPSTLTPQHAEALSRCESDANSLSLKGRSSDYDDGLQNAQREFLQQIGEIKNKVRSGDLPGAALQRDKVKRIFQTLSN